MRKQKENKDKTRLYLHKRLDEGEDNLLTIAKEAIENFQLSMKPTDLKQRFKYQAKNRMEKTPIDKFCEQQGIDTNSIDIAGGYMKGVEEESGMPITLRFKTKTKTEEVYKIEDMLSGITNKMAKHSPKYYSQKRSDVKNGHLLVLNPCDLHLGKLSVGLGNDYNTDIAINRALEGVEGILKKSSGFDVDQIVLLISNDILHTDNMHNTTTKGTPQSVSGIWYDNFSKAIELYVAIVDKLLGVANVHVMACPSNHDYVSSHFLAQTIKTWYRKSKQVTFDVSIKHRKYYSWEKNLIGASHGDGAKEALLPQLMANEAGQAWIDCPNRIWLLGHIHHKIAKDYVGVTIEYCRSASGSDLWHDNAGYTGVPKAVEGFLFSKNDGIVARLTHIFK